MSLRTTPPFRADHVGSLLRPPACCRPGPTGPRAGSAPTSCGRSRTRRSATSCACSATSGSRSATDGEFRRTSWHMDFIYRLGGVSKADGSIRVRMHNEDGDVEFTAPALQINAPIRLSEPIFGDDFVFLKSIVDDGVTAKLTIPSPSMVHYRGGRAAIDPAVYPDDDSFWADLSAAYAAQVRAMAELGCEYLQLDDTSLAYLNDPAQRAELAAARRRRRAPAPALHQADQRRAGRPAEVVAVTTHMCRGNFRSSWAASGSYDFVAEALFSELAVDGFFLEFDDERSGGFAPLRFVPRGKMVVLGPGHHQARRSWSPRTTSSAASTRPPSTCRSSSCACRRSAGSPPQWRATRSATTSRWPSCG